MSLSSRTTGTHNHLAPRKKHLSSHSGTHAAQGASPTNTDAPQRERPFAPLKFDEQAPAAKGSAYKSIFQL